MGCLGNRLETSEVDDNTNGNTVLATHSSCCVATEELCQTPKKVHARGSQPERSLSSDQCKYPGYCRNKRAFKRNGERHWLCAEHRDHQNTMQRDRYRKTTKKDGKKETKKKTTAIKKRKIQNSTSLSTKNKGSTPASTASIEDSCSSTSRDNVVVEHVELDVPAVSNAQRPRAVEEQGGETDAGNTVSI
ncbi:uncharacterized protein PITG_16164 [Phytophthora infestans T30-4]|uniref:Uncharacterized protein n=1 Tax=Phytophthora infestans (strain T30-4) TaxID=403677 RepID=D0NTA2_PHYIT|nr:uncharacterized protein PITG_16164 [Phytophthora infestans T30-4]EEY64853.1 hypothetical protein PITG_16164 [Phytophthora infestans T30-4]|eukprot:XP_002897583.1 hypothetical protein PITG_16164 [Phytophthora infestans T30-4]